MKKTPSVHLLVFFFWKTSLSRKTLDTKNFHPNLPRRINIQVLERAAAYKTPALKQLLGFGYHSCLVLKARGLLHEPGVCVTVKPASRLPLTPSWYQNLEELQHTQQRRKQWESGKVTHLLLSTLSYL